MTRIRHLLAASLVAAASFATAHAKLADDAKSVTPLAVGSPAPAVTVKDADGKSHNLAELVKAQPTILIVYRGGWCPFCNAHLGELAELEPELAELGYRILALSPERPENLRAALRENPPTPHRLVLSDREMEATAALGLAYAMPAKLQKKYTKYGIDLAPVPGNPDQAWLPVPAAFVFDGNGDVTFVYHNDNYKQRVEPKDLMTAAKAAVE